MRAKLQRVGMDIETVIVMAHAGVDCEEEPLDGMSGSLVAHSQKSAETLSDREYANAMEERYGIREEGIF